MRAHWAALTLLGYRKYMIDALLRRPASAAEVASDGIRLLGAVSLLAALLWYGPVEAALFALVLLGLLVSRCLPAAPLFSSLYGLTLLLAAWSSVMDLYARISWWDLAVHFAATGTIAVMAWYLLAAYGAVTAWQGSGRPVPGVAVPAVVTVAGPGTERSLGVWRVVGTQLRGCHDQRRLPGHDRRPGCGRTRIAALRHPAGPPDPAEPAAPLQAGAAEAPLQRRLQG